MGRRGIPPGGSLLGSGRNFLMGRRGVPWGGALLGVKGISWLGEGFPQGEEGTSQHGEGALPRKGLCQEQKEILDRAKNIIWGGSPLGAENPMRGRKQQPHQSLE